jgi:hypothetical protein
VELLLPPALAPPATIVSAFDDDAAVVAAAAVAAADRENTDEGAVWVMAAMGTLTPTTPEPVTEAEAEEDFFGAFESTMPSCSWVSSAAATSSLDACQSSADWESMSDTVTSMFSCW